MKSNSVRRRYIYLARQITQRLQTLLGELEKTHEMMLRIDYCRQIDPQLRAWDMEMQILEAQLPPGYFISKAKAVADAAAQQTAT